MPARTIRLKAASAILFLVILCAAFSACYGPPPPPPPPPEEPSRQGPWGTLWHPYEKGLRLARERNQPVFIYFMTENCRWCTVMENKTYGNRTVAEYLKRNFILVEVNTRKEKEIRIKYGIIGVPSFCFLAPGGRRTYPRLGFVGPSHFLNVVRTYQRSRYY